MTREGNGLRIFLYKKSKKYEHKVEQRNVTRNNNIAHGQDK